MGIEGPNQTMRPTGGPVRWLVSVRETRYSISILEYSSEWGGKQMQIIARLMLPLWLGLVAVAQGAATGRLG